MSVILKDIDVKKRKTSKQEKENQLESMSFYIDMAKKCISIFSGPSFCKSMIKDEDAISHVAEHIMWGHTRWDADRGRSLKSYLNQCGIWAIKVWQTKVYNKSNTNKILSLNHPLDQNDSSCELSDLIQDTSCSTPYQELYDNTSLEVNEFIDSDCLTPLQKICLQSRYIEGKKLREIAELLSVTRQAVNQHIKKAITKLRKRNGICER